LLIGIPAREGSPQGNRMNSNTSRVVIRSAPTGLWFRLESIPRITLRSILGYLGKGEPPVLPGWQSNFDIFGSLTWACGAPIGMKIGLSRSGVGYAARGTVKVVTTLDS
jgi:hypothetical protein